MICFSVSSMKEDNSKIVFTENFSKKTKTLEVSWNKNKKEYLLL